MPASFLPSNGDKEAIKISQQTLGSERLELDVGGR